jgi:5'-3' exonuclease
MGIRGLKSWITTYFPGAMQKLTVQDGVQGDTVDQTCAGGKVGGQAGCALVEGSYDHVLFDMNAIVHAACGKSSTEEQAMEEIILQLDSVLLLFPATTCVYIALDGVGPTAKIMEQRRRRIAKARKDARDEEALIPGSAESQRRLEFYQRRNEKRKERGQQPLPPQKEGKRMVVDSLQITPGTMFMLRLKRMLNWYSASRMRGEGGVFSFHKPCIVISAADVSGEGETKLLQHVHAVLRALPSPHAAPPSFLFVSPDNDALLLALVSGAMRCDVLVMERKGLAKSQLFSVKSLCDTVVRQLGAPPLRDPRDHQAVAMGGKYQLDFLAVCFLTGNDYLPKLQGSSLPLLWSRLIRLLGAGGEHHGEHLLLPSEGRVEVNMPLLIKLAGSSCANHGSGGGGGGGDDDDDDDVIIMMMVYLITKLT